MTLNADTLNVNTSSTKPLSLNDFDYHLPDGLIARYPLSTRSASRLLCLDGQGRMSDRQFTDLPSLINAGDLLVFNDTKVMKARLFGKKPTGGQLEALIERIVPDVSALPPSAKLDPSSFGSHGVAYPYLALCHIKASKAPKAGQLLIFGQTDSDTQIDSDNAANHVHACCFGRADNLFVVGFATPILPMLERFGELPIPPYFERLADDNDDSRYQTVFHNPDKLASVAAPTASLHFDDEILQALKNKGVQTAFVTLHVGAGTFAPVKTDDILSHKMHAEYADLPQATADSINQTKKNGNKIIAVGTTVTRVLETAFNKTASFDNPDLSAWAGDTDIFIYPPYRFGVIDGLVTNFHLPKSTLLMLVSAFAGVDNIKKAYHHAISQHYRFFSYGDAMFLEKQEQ